MTQPIDIGVYWSLTGIAIFLEDLLYIDHFVPVGSGIIDTLGLDNEKNPVMIEYKVARISVEKFLPLS